MRPTHHCGTRRGCGRPIARRLEYPDAGLRCVEGNLEHPLKGDLGKQIVRGGPYDLIIMANCLNELFPASIDPPAERAAVVAQLLPFLAPHGTIMIVEPALAADGSSAASFA